MSQHSHPSHPRSQRSSVGKTPSCHEENENQIEERPAGSALDELQRQVEEELRNSDQVLSRIGSRYSRPASPPAADRSFHPSYIENVQTNYQGSPRTPVSTRSRRNSPGSTPPGVYQPQEEMVENPLGDESVYMETPMEEICEAESEYYPSPENYGTDVEEQPIDQSGEEMYDTTISPAATASGVRSSFDRVQSMPVYDANESQSRNVSGQSPMVMEQSMREQSGVVGSVGRSSGYVSSAGRGSAGRSTPGMGSAGIGTPSRGYVGVSSAAMSSAGKGSAGRGSGAMISPGMGTPSRAASSRAGCTELDCERFSQGPGATPRSGTRSVVFDSQGQYSQSECMVSGNRSQVENAYYYEPEEQNVQGVVSGMMDEDQVYQRNAESLGSPYSRPTSVEASYGAQSCSSTQSSRAGAAGQPCPVVSSSRAGVPGQPCPVPSSSLSGAAGQPCPVASNSRAGAAGQPCPVASSARPPCPVASSARPPCPVASSARPPCPVASSARPPCPVASSARPPCPRAQSPKSQPCPTPMGGQQQPWENYYSQGAGPRPEVTFGAQSSDTGSSKAGAGAPTYQRPHTAAGQPCQMQGGSRGQPYQRAQSPMEGAGQSCQGENPMAEPWDNFYLHPPSPVPGAGGRPPCHGGGAGARPPCPASGAGGRPPFHGAVAGGQSYPRPPSPGVTNGAHAHHKAPTPGAVGGAHSHHGEHGMGVDHMESEHHAHGGSRGYPPNEKRTQALYRLSQFKKTPSLTRCQVDKGLDFLNVCCPKAKLVGKIVKLPEKPCLSKPEIENLVKCEARDVEDVLYMSSDVGSTYKKPCPKQQKAQMSVQALVQAHAKQVCPTTHYPPLDHPDPEDISPELAAAMMFSQEQGLEMEKCPYDIVAHLYPDEPEVSFPRRARQSNVSVVGSQKEQDAIIEKSASVPSEGVSDSAYSTKMKERGEEMEARSSYDVDFAIGQTKRQYVLVTQQPDRINKVQFRGGRSPQWFPGYFSAFPDEPGLNLVPSPSEVFQKAWVHSNPKNMPTNDVIVLD